MSDRGLRQIQGQSVRAWIIQPNAQPLPRVKCNRSEVYGKGRETRLLVDNRSVRIVGKGILHKVRPCKRGADPPKKSMGRTGANSTSSHCQAVEMSRCVSSGKGSRITVVIFASCEYHMRSLTLYTRSLGLSAAIMLSSTLDLSSLLDVSLRGVS